METLTFIKNPKRRCENGSDSSSLALRPRLVAPPGPAPAAMRLFRNDVVLAKITKNLPTKELLQLRGASASLNRISINKLKENPFKIDLYRTPDKGRDKDIKGKAMEAYTNFMRSRPWSSEIPFTHYEIMPSAPAPILDDFFAVCGPSIRQLQLCSVWNNQPEPLNRIRQIIFQLTPELVDLDLILDTRKSSLDGEENLLISAQNLPKLRRLVVTHNDQHHADWEAVLGDIFRSANGLQTLEIRGSGSGGHRQSSPSWLTILRDASHNLGALKTLKLEHFSGVDASELQIFLEAAAGDRGLRLRDLSIVIQRNGHEPLEFEFLLQNFLRTQSATLQGLKLDLRSYQHPNRNHLPGVVVRIPKMPEITEFQILRYGDMPIDLQYDEPGLAETMPKLKRFSYHGTEFALATSRRDLDFAALAGVTALALNGNWDVMGDPGTRFPSLTSIELDLHLPAESRSDLSTLWTTWPELLHMKLCVWNTKPSRGLIGGQELDQFLTGVAQMDDLKLEFDTCKQRALAPMDEIKRARRLLRSYKTKPGVSDLKSLRSFHLILGFAQNRVCSNVTDLSGYFGFAMASKALERLVICTTGGIGPARPFRRVSMTPECRALIKEALAPWAVIDIQ